MNCARESITRRNARATRSPARGTLILAAMLLASASCSDRNLEGPGVGTSDVDYCRVDRSAVEARIDELLPQMSLAEKVAQMAGSNFQDGWATPANDRLGIPPLRMLDGPRGVSSLVGKATAFPVGMARGATWDADLEQRVGAAIGAEIRAKGASVLLAPTINVLRHPAWGRAQETYGEDPLHIGKMGVGFVLGAQEHVLASAKHYALNSIENTRFTVNVTADERTLREVYLPHFRMAVRDARVASIMTAYNKVNGFYCAENDHLVRDILKGEWGFDGFVESDWVLGTRSTVGSALAGLDIEMPSAVFYDADLIAAVEGGQVPIERIDDAVRRVLRAKFCLALDTEPPVKDPSVIGSRAHAALALEVAQKSIVLLKNEGGALPLDRAAIGSVAVVGPLADRPNIGDTGSSSVNPEYVITALAGITARAGTVTVHSITGDASSPDDQSTIAAAGAAVVVVGLTSADEGESIVGPGDRLELSLSADQEALIRTVAAANARTIVVLEGGSAITMESWIDAPEALLMAWYPGQEGGNAIADVLFGDVNPSGKLPFSIPRSEADLPEFDPASLEVTYDYYHGYRHLDRNGIEPRYAFGYGSSYTTFAYSNLRVRSASLAARGTAEVTVDVTNTGAIAGDEIVQLYVAAVGSSVDRPVKDLRAFARVPLAPGETRSVSLDVPVEDLAYYDTAAARWVVEPIGYRVQVGPSSRDLPLEGSFTVRNP